MKYSYLSIALPFTAIFASRVPPLVPTQCRLLEQLAHHFGIVDPSASSNNLSRTNKNNPCGIPWNKDRVIENSLDLSVPKMETNDMSLEGESLEISPVVAEKIMIKYDYAHGEALLKTINIAGRAFELIGSVVITENGIEAFAQSNDSGKRGNKFVKYFKGPDHMPSCNLLVSEPTFNKIEVHRDRRSELSHHELYLEGLDGACIYRTSSALYRELRSPARFNVWPASIDYGLITLEMMPKFLQSPKHLDFFAYDIQVSGFQVEIVGLIRAMQIFGRLNFRDSIKDECLRAILKAVSANNKNPFDDTKKVKALLEKAAEYLNKFYNVAGAIEYGSYMSHLLDNEPELGTQIIRPLMRWEGTGSTGIVKGFENDAMVVSNSRMLVVCISSGPIPTKLVVKINAQEQPTFCLTGIIGFDGHLTLFEDDGIDIRFSEFGSAPDVVFHHLSSFPAFEFTKRRQRPGIFFYRRVN